MSEKTCFVIAPIGDGGSETRKRSDRVLKYIIKPAVAECGYTEPIRADKLSHPGMITSQVIQHIVEDSLVIADLSEHNPNVFYELAIRHAMRKPLVHIIRKDEAIPFDVTGMRAIKFDIQDLENVEESKEEMIRQIRHLEQEPEDIETPISQALDLKDLRGSNKPEDRLLAQLLPAITELKLGIAEIQRNTSLTNVGAGGPSWNTVKSIMSSGGYLNPSGIVLTPFSAVSEIPTYNPNIRTPLERFKSALRELDSDAWENLSIAETKAEGEFLVLTISNKRKAVFQKLSESEAERKTFDMASRKAGVKLKVVYGKKEISFPT